MTTQLPENRWQGIYLPPISKALVDSMTPALGTRSTAPKNYPLQVDIGLLDALAFEEDAFAYDPGGPESQRRRALDKTRLLHSLVGTEAGFQLLMELNAAVGYTKLVGDYDSSGTKVNREGNNDEERRIMRGTHSLHTSDPNTADVNRETGVVTPGFRHDGQVYHKWIRVDILIPIDREDDIRLQSFLARAVRRVIPYTLKIESINLIRAYEKNIILDTVYDGAHFIWLS